MRQYETTGAIPSIEFHLDLTVAPDGSAHVESTIRLGTGPQSRVLVAQGPGQASCADADGDGSAGLVRLAAEFRDVGTGNRVGVTLVPTRADIDASGNYEITLTIGGEPRTLLTRFRVSTVRRYCRECAAASRVRAPC